MWPLGRSEILLGRGSLGRRSRAVGVSRKRGISPFRVSGHDHPEVCDLLRGSRRWRLERQVFLGLRGWSPLLLLLGDEGHWSPGTGREDRQLHLCRM